MTQPHHLQVFQLKEEEREALVGSIPSIEACLTRVDDIEVSKDASASFNAIRRFADAFQSTLWNHVGVPIPLSQTVVTNLRIVSVYRANCSSPHIAVLHTSCARPSLPPRASRHIGRRQCWGCESGGRLICLLDRKRQGRSDIVMSGPEGVQVTSISIET